MKKYADPRLARILKRYGEAHQRTKLVEEVGEMLAELGRFMSGELTNVADLIHECADVLVVLRQLWPGHERRADIGPQADSAALRWHAQGLVESAAKLIETALNQSNISEHEDWWARNVEVYIFALASSLDELPMLLEAIEMKTARQIERIEREAGPRGTQKENR